MNIHSSFLTSQRVLDLLKLMLGFWMKNLSETSITRTLSLSKITGLRYRKWGLYWGQADLDGVSVRLEMRALKQCLFFMVMAMPGCDDVRGAELHYVTTARPMTHAWLWWPQGTPQSWTTFGGEGCYKVSPSHTHKQDTITDIQCGCQFVWFIGDVVANVASVSFRGSGRLQIFPSQQEVQIWKKVRRQRVRRSQLVSTSWQMLYNGDIAWHPWRAIIISHLEAACSKWKILASISGDLSSFLGISPVLAARLQVL